MGRIQGKTAIVMGAGTGIGRAIALRFAEEGADVIAVARTKANVDEVATASGNCITPMSCDIKSEESIQTLIEAARKKWGRLDILVNSAGISQGSSRPTHEVPTEIWDDVIATNLRGAFMLMKYALPFMMNSGDGGSIINLSSMVGARAARGRCAYATTKGGIINLTGTVALEYAEYKIRANSILPGVTMTPLVKNSLKVAPDLMKPVMDKIPLKRAAEPEEIASLALFLASDESLFITGAAYVIDGGSIVSV